MGQFRNLELGWFFRGNFFWHPFIYVQSHEMRFGFQRGWQLFFPPALSFGICSLGTGSKRILNCKMEERQSFTFVFLIARDMCVCMGQREISFY